MTLDLLTPSCPLILSDNEINNLGTSQAFDLIVLPTFVIDCNHTVTHWNKALEALSGLSKSTVIGSQLQWKAFYAQHRPTLADLILEGGDQRDVENYYGNKFQRSDLLEGAVQAEGFFADLGDSGKWLSFTAVSIKNADGEVIGAIETLSDITKRKVYELELQQRERMYRDLSITDALTGLYNSRHFRDVLEKEIDRSNRYSTPLSLCLLDLDNFKSLNDRYGHLFGDQVLESFGKLIKKGLRSSDCGFRYGGEEFALILPNTHQHQGKILAARLLESLARTTQLVEESTDSVEVTASAGLIEFVPGQTMKQLIKQADDAMYLAKSQGKNRVV